MVCLDFCLEKKNADGHLKKLGYFFTDNFNLRYHMPQHGVYLSCVRVLPHGLTKTKSKLDL